MRRETREESVYIWRIGFRQCGDVCRNVTQWRCRRWMRSVKIALSTSTDVRYWRCWGRVYVVLCVSFVCSLCQGTSSHKVDESVCDFSLTNKSIKCYQGYSTGKRMSRRLSVSVCVDVQRTKCHAKKDVGHGFGGFRLWQSGQGSHSCLDLAIISNTAYCSIHLEISQPAHILALWPIARYTKTLH